MKDEVNISANELSEIIIEKMDFDETHEIERELRKISDQLNKISGSIYRLSQDQAIFFSHEKMLNEKLELKRKELAKRYKVDETRSWRIDINTRKVIYSK